MTVTERRRRIDANRSVKDIRPGDCVRKIGHRGVGFVEDMPDESNAWVSWKSGILELLPLVMLRKVRAGGHKYDSRRWQP
jgi:hypothetical protein